MTMMMEDLSSVWAYPESIDAMKKKLAHKNIELEQVKKQADEELRKSKEYINQLLNLLKVAYRERDGARERLRLLNKLILLNPTELNTILPLPQSESPLLIPANANSSITESNSLSETYNHQSHGSSPVDSLFDAVTSPELSNINVADTRNINGFVNQAPFVREFNASVSGNFVSSGKLPADPASALIDDLVKGRTLPQKGRLLQAVMDSGPLLQNLLVAGPLPRWRNPPPMRPIKIPPVPIKGPEEVGNVNKKSVANMRHFNQRQINSCSAQTCSASMLNFAAGRSGSLLNTGRVMASGGVLSNEFLTCKRQRLQ